MLSDCESQNPSQSVNASHRKAVVQIKVAGAAEPLLITCLSSEMAESIADLVDRYCRLVNGTNVSLWNKRDLVSRSRPGFRLSASASRNNSRNASPEVRRFGCRD